MIDKFDPEYVKQFTTKLNNLKEKLDSKDYSLIGIPHLKQ